MYKVRPSKTLYGQTEMYECRILLAGQPGGFYKHADCQSAGLGRAVPQGVHQQVRLVREGGARDGGVTGRRPADRGAELCAAG